MTTNAHPHTSEPHTLLSPPLLVEQNEPGGVWIPNTFLDRSLPVVGYKGLLIYVFLARCARQSDYPGVRDLARLTGITTPTVRKLLQRLRLLGELNASDLARVVDDDAPTAEDMAPEDLLDEQEDDHEGSSHATPAEVTISEKQHTESE